MRGEEVQVREPRRRGHLHLRVRGDMDAVAGRGNFGEGAQRGRLHADTAQGEPGRCRKMPVHLFPYRRHPYRAGAAQHRVAGERLLVPRRGVEEQRVSDSLPEVGEDRQPAAFQDGGKDHRREGHGRLNTERRRQVPRTA